MGRRRFAQSSVDQDTQRWVLPYADLLTLLLALFITLYAFSVSKKENFSQVSLESQKEHQAQTNASMMSAFWSNLLWHGTNQTWSLKSPSSGFDQLQHQLKPLFSRLMNQGLLDFKPSEHWVQIDIKGQVLFQSGRADIEPKAKAVIAELAQILANVNNLIAVEGYSDDQPIQSQLYPSNWELSAARAAAVIRVLAEQGVSPSRLRVMAYAQYQPVASNSTPQGRRQNRRISILILNNPKTVVSWSPQLPLQALP